MNHTRKIEPIKRADALKKLEAGHVGFLAEYRGMSAAEIPYVSKKTGKQAVMKKATHAVEVNSQPVQISEILPDDIAIELALPIAAKGSLVLVTLRAFDSLNGALTGRGTLVPVVG